MPGKKLNIKIRKGTLTQCGYSIKDPTNMRRKAIHKCIKYMKRTPLELFRKLNLIAILQKRTHPDYARKFISDRNYIKKFYM